MSVHQLYRIHTTSASRLLQALEPPPAREETEHVPDAGDLEDFSLPRPHLYLVEETQSC